MKKLLCSAGIFLTLFGTTFAAPSAPENMRVLEVSDTSIHIDWEDTNGAIGYYMYHGTQTGSGGSYEIEGIELIETSDYILEGLAPDTNYYMAVTAIDEFGSESVYSQEFEYETLEVGATSEVTSFRIKDVTVIDESTLEFIFSSDLDVSPGAVMEFIIEEKISGTEVPIDISQVNENDKKNVIVLLGEGLVPAQEYKVTVLDISDASGNTIESGIDAFISFIMPVITKDDSTEEDDTETSFGETNQVEETIDPTGTGEDDVDLLSADDQKEMEAGVTVSGENAGTTLSHDELSGNMSLTAQENDKLPQTGPELWILFFLAILIAAGVLTIGIKKHSS